MSDTGSVSMVAVFVGGPADGGELALLEPIPQVVVFPMTAVRAAVVLARPQPPASGSFGGSAWLNTMPGGVYRLAMTDNRVERDNRRRIVYRYLPAVRPTAAPNPTEGEPHE